MALLLPLALNYSYASASTMTSGGISFTATDPGVDTSRAEAENLIQRIENESAPQYAEGFQLLKLVTSQEFSDLYEKSCELYLKGLGQNHITKNDYELLKEDLFHMKPFFGRREANGYEEMIEEGNPEIFPILRIFGVNVI